MQSILIRLFASVLACIIGLSVNLLWHSIVGPSGHLPAQDTNLRVERVAAIPQHSCEVHHIAMHKERVVVTVLPYIKIVTDTPYYKDSHIYFPHAGYQVLREGPFDGKKRIEEELDICTKCREAERAYCFVRPGRCGSHR